MALGFKDPWVILGVDRTAGDGEIKRAYRKLAIANHPDHNQGDSEAEARFQDIARAFEEISTEEKRMQWLSEQEEATTPFPDLEGDATAAAARGKTHTIQREVHLDFQHAFKGTQVEIDVDIEDICAICGGSGSAPGHRPRKCDVCGGSGQHRVGRVQNPCSRCLGKGFIIESPCPSCEDGRTSRIRPFVLQIPPGVPDGHKMRIESPRRSQLSNPAVYVTVSVEESPVFKRQLSDPADLMIEVPISFTEAALGAAVRIPTPTRVIALRVPAGTPSGKPFRINGEGMPRLQDSSRRGDLYAQVQIVVPSDPSAKQKRLIRDLGDHDSEHLRSALFESLATAGGGSADG